MKISMLVPFVLVGVTVASPAPANWLNDMSRATGHPGPLTTEFLDPKYMADGETSAPLWCTGVRAPSNTFAGLGVSIFKRGSFLSPKKVTTLDTAVTKFTQSVSSRFQQRSKRSGMTNASFAIHSTDLTLHDHEKNAIDSPIRVITTVDGRKGYFFVVGFGPGGAGYMAALPSSDNQYDIVISTSVSFEGPGLNRTDESKLYQDRLKNQPYQLLWDAAMVVDNSLKTKELNPESLGNELRNTRKAELVGFDIKNGKSVPLTLLSSNPILQAGTNEPPASPLTIFYSSESEEITVSSPGYRPKKVTLGKLAGMMMIGMDRDEKANNSRNTP